MKPIIILPPDTMSSEDITKLEGNDLCVVVAKDPARVKFLDPIPASSSRTQIETAAIELSRKILNKGFWSSEATRDNMTKCFVDILIKGTKLDPEPSQEEVEKKAYNFERLEEIRKMAREDARRERAAAKKREADRKRSADKRAVNKEGAAP